MHKEQKAKELDGHLSENPVSTLVKLKPHTCRLTLVSKADIYNQYSEKKSIESLPRQWHDTQVGIDNAIFSFSVMHSEAWDGQAPSINKMDF